MKSRHLHGALLAVLLVIAIGQPAGAMTAEGWYEKGLALYQQGKDTDAIAAYDRAIALDPNYASPWNGKGKALENQGNSSAADAAYDRASALDPEKAQVTGQHDRDRASQTTRAGGHPLAVLAVVVATVILAAGRRLERP